MDNTPDRQIDPDDCGTYIECKGDSSDCMKLVLESKHKAFRCGPCWKKYVREYRQREMREALIDITRGF